MVNYRVSTNINSNKNKMTQDKINEQMQQRQIDRLRLFIFKREFLKISLDLQTTLTAETHIAEGQLLEKQLNILKLPMFREGTRMPTT
jgi:hypothetical protein